jgi:hypothetical protein
VRDTRAIKTCKRCGATKARSEFYPSRVRRDGMHMFCKPCAHADDNIRNERLVSWTAEEFIQMQQEVRSVT